MWARVHFVWGSVYRAVVTFVYSTRTIHDTMMSVLCFEAFLLYFCLFFNLQSVLFSLHHLFGFIGSMASLIFCTCFAFVFHMKCVFIWNLAIFIFYLKNFHMKWFFFILFNSYENDLFSLSHILQMHCICFSYEICFYMKFSYFLKSQVCLFHIKCFAYENNFTSFKYFFKWNIHLCLFSNEILSCCLLPRNFDQFGEVLGKQQ